MKNLKRDYKKKNIFDKYRLYTIVVLFLIPSLYASDHAVGDAANFGFQLLEEPLNPKFIAMGSAGTAVGGNGFAYYNPALPYILDRTYLSFEYGQYPKADLKHLNLEVSFRIRKLFFGISLHSETIDKIFPVGPFGNLPYYNAPSSAQLTNMSLNIGFTQWDNLAFAVCLNATQDRIFDEYAYALSFSAGTIYNPIPKHLYLGLSILNVGSSTPMEGMDSLDTFGKGEYLPLNSRFGISWIDTLKGFPYTITMDIVYRNVYEKSKPFKRNIQDRFSIPVGFEVKVLPSLAIRVGKRFNFQSEILNLGIGLNSKNLAIDASFIIPKLVNDNELKWLTCITYLIDSKRKKGK